MAKAIIKVSKTRMITVEEGSSLQDKLNVVESMQFDRGYLLLLFINKTKIAPLNYKVRSS